MNLKYTKRTAILIACFEFFYNGQAQNKHADLTPYFTTHHISFSKHPETQFSDAEITSFLSFGNSILQTCNNVTSDDQDVACRVGFDKSGITNTFGSVDDGLDIINTDDEASTVLSNNQSFVKLVTTIISGKDLINGQATRPGSSIMLATSNSYRTNSQIGETFVHEFGHCQGLQHRGDLGAPPLIGNPIMRSFSNNIIRDEVDQEEVTAYHDGNNIGERNYGNFVDISFVIDNTGSMGPEIDQVKQRVLKILSDPKYTDQGCATTVFQLITFKDNVTVNLATSEINLIKSEVAALTASGGDDCPESSLEALNTAKDFVKVGGVIYTATDADPHSDPNLSDIKSTILAKSISLSVLLSGTCEGSSSRLISNYSPSLNDSISKVGNSDINAGESDPINVFSYLCDGTGGIFSFIPLSDFPTTEELTHYGNTWENLLSGGIESALINAEPFNIPAGSTTTITINAQKTQFNSSTSFNFGDANISVEQIKILSPVQAQVTVKVNSSTALGFKDVSSQTLISGGSFNFAKGTGLIEIINQPSSPTITGISPNSGKSGEKLTVIVSGVNTHFDNTSKLTIGEGINVENISPLSQTQIKAEILISDSAAIGYRDVVVTTGSEVAEENVDGPFLVIFSDCNLSGLDLGEDITLNKTDSSCVNLQVFGLNPDSLESYSFKWNTGDTTSSIRVCPDTTTTYSIKLIKGSCVFTDNVTVFVNSGNPSHLTIMDLNVSGSQNLAFVKVKLTNPSNKVVTVKYLTKDSTAKRGEDYASINGFITFIPHINKTAVIPIEILHKDQTTGDKYFKVILMRATNADITDSSAIVTIKCAEANNTVSSQRITFDSKVQILKNDNLQIIADPNPSSNIFKIKIVGNNKGKANLSIYNEVGGVVDHRVDVEGKTIEIGSTYKPGVYLIQVIQGNKTKTARIIKISK